MGQYWPVLVQYWARIQPAFCQLHMFSGIVSMDRLSLQRQCLQFERRTMDPKQKFRVGALEPEILRAMTEKKVLYTLYEKAFLK